jgi:tetratricopeptide (TPR) repeat protein
MTHHRNTHLRVSVSMCAGLCLVSIADSRPSPALQVSQTAPATDEAAKANEAYQAKDWVKAALLYQQVVLHQPNNGRAWYRLASSSHALDKQDEAIAAYQKSMEVGSPPGIAEYGIALAYAAKHDTENTFQYLQRAVNRRFDFWIGEWDVVTAEGANSAGTSKIELILGDCVIQENWTSAGNIGYQGKSFNIYNADLNRWEQFWSDNVGGMIHFYGGLSEGVMHFWTDEIPQKDGTRLKRHLQFIPSGKDKLRQFSQSSTDGSKTWKVEYDFIYTRKK